MKRTLLALALMTIATVSACSSSTTAPAQRNGKDLTPDECDKLSLVAFYLPPECNR